MSKCSEVLRMLMRAGWSVERQKGSHLVLSHPGKTHKIVFPNHGSAEMKTGTMNAMLKAADLKNTKK